MKAEDFNDGSNEVGNTTKYRQGIRLKVQKDLVASAMEHVVKMDESGITDLMLQIEAEYERKYGDNVANIEKTVL